MYLDYPKNLKKFQPSYWFLSMFVNTSVFAYFTIINFKTKYNLTSLLSCKFWLSFTTSFKNINAYNYSLNKKEWICSLFKEWILEKSDIRVNLEWTFVLFTHFGVTSGITQGFRVIPEVTPKWVNNTNVHSKFTPLISLFSKIHSLKSEQIHSFFV